MKFLVDECLSPQLARRLAETGYDATCVRDRAKLSRADAAILEYAIQEDRIIVTQNADDFRKLVGTVEAHPGLVILSASSVEKSWEELRHAVDYIADHDNPHPPSDWMINRVVEVDGKSITDYALPPANRQ